jgi:hypothetical protein
MSEQGETVILNAQTNTDASDTGDSTQSTDFSNEQSTENVDTKVEAGAEVTPDKSTGEEDQQGKIEGSEEESGDKEKGESVPEKYDNFKLPEGIKMDEKALEQFSPLAKELNLSQENAQKIIDVMSAKVKRDAEVNKEAFQKLQQGWAKQVKNDPDIGGDNFKQNANIANRALNQFGGEEVAGILKDSGLQNHPGLVKMFVKIGKAIGDDSFSQDEKGESTVKPKGAKAIYNNSPQLK